MYPVRRQTNRYASTLRANRTDCENIVWQSLRNRQLADLKFRFQASVGPYVVDFLCVEAGLVVELDGGQHSVDDDAARTAFLESKGLQVLRFWNSDVIENRSSVLERIRLDALERITAKKKTLTQPSPAKAGEDSAS